jgi:hypothetical protein
VEYDSAKQIGRAGFYTKLLEVIQGGESLRSGREEFALIKFITPFMINAMIVTTRSRMLLR